MNVFIIIKRVSEDYHGIYDSICGVYANKDYANRIAEHYNETEGNYDIEFFVEFYPVINL